MKIPFSTQDKLRAALGLTLLCGICLPTEEVQAKTKEPGKANQSKKSASGRELKPDGAKFETKPAKDPVAAPEPSAKAPPSGKDPCPACGRG